MNTSESAVGGIILSKKLIVHAFPSEQHEGYVCMASDNAAFIYLTPEDALLFATAVAAAANEAAGYEVTEG
jgi:hypothetical protein